MTGSEPRSPRQTGHVAGLGGRPNCVLHTQKSLVFVRSWTCTSSPTTVLYGAPMTVPEMKKRTTESQRQDHREESKRGRKNGALRYRFLLCVFYPRCSL